MCVGMIVFVIVWNKFWILIFCCDRVEWFLNSFVRFIFIFVDIVCWYIVIVNIFLYLYIVYLWWLIDGFLGIYFEVWGKLEWLICVFVIEGYDGNFYYFVVICIEVWGFVFVGLLFWVLNYVLIMYSIWFVVVRIIVYWIWFVVVFRIKLIFKCGWWIVVSLMWWRFWRKNVVE